MKRLIDNHRVVAVVGAGGKTSLVHALAMGCQERGTIVTTTTRIYPPDHMPVVLWPEGTPVPHIPPMACIARHQADDKLLGITPMQADELAASIAPRPLFIEADGARGRSLKAPATHEPVIPASATLVIAVVGADCATTPLDGPHVFRADQVAALTGARKNATPTIQVDAPLLATLADHPQGIFKSAPSHAARLVFVNKWDAATQAQREIFHQAAATSTHAWHAGSAVTGTYERL